MRKKRRNDFSPAPERGATVLLGVDELRRLNEENKRLKRETRELRGNMLAAIRGYKEALENNVRLIGSIDAAVDFHKTLIDRLSSDSAVAKQPADTPQQQRGEAAESAAAHPMDIYFEDAQGMGYTLSLHAGDWKNEDGSSCEDTSYSLPLVVGAYEGDDVKPLAKLALKRGSVKRMYNFLGNVL
jgi:hypothetical protein